MTANQITKKLEKSGIDTNGLEIHRDEIEVYIKTKNGEFSHQLTNKKVNQIKKVLGWKNGYRAGYGAWVIQKSSTDMGDYNDKSSRWHY